MGYSVVADEIDQFANYLTGTVRNDLDTIRLGAITEGANSDGFTGALAGLVGIMDEFGERINEAFQYAIDSVSTTGTALYDVALTYGDTEKTNSKLMGTE